MLDLAAADETVRQLLPRAGAIALEWFRTPLTPDDKGSPDGYDPVTEADRGIEAHLRAGIAARFPDHRIVGEETGQSGPDDAAVTWMIDPIDGTKAFVTGSPLWATLIGLVADGAPVAGWVHQPYLDETFAGVAGKGTFERAGRREPLAASGCTELALAAMYTTHPSMFTGTPDEPAFARLSRGVRLSRFGGDCYAYCLLALGHVDLVVENQLQPYDIVPLVPLIEAAGGVVTDRSGDAPLAGGFVVAAATPELHARALAVVNEETT